MVWKQQLYIVDAQFTNFLLSSRSVVSLGTFSNPHNPSGVSQDRIQLHANTMKAYLWDHVHGEKNKKTKENISFTRKHGNLIYWKVSSSWRTNVDILAKIGRPYFDYR